MTHITCRLTAKNRDQLRNRTLGSRVGATFTFLSLSRVRPCRRRARRTAGRCDVRRCRPTARGPSTTTTATAARAATTAVPRPARPRPRRPPPPPQRRATCAVDWSRPTTGGCPTPPTRAPSASVWYVAPRLVQGGYIFYAGAGYCRQCRRRPAILPLQLWQGCQVCVKISAQRLPRVAQFYAC